MTHNMTLEEFIEHYSAVKVLRDNLQANLDAMTDMSERDKKALLRVHMIMIRQCLEDFGA